MHAIVQLMHNGLHEFRRTGTALHRPIHANLSDKNCKKCINFTRIEQSFFNVQRSRQALLSSLSLSSSPPQLALTSIFTLEFYQIFWFCATRINPNGPNTFNSTVNFTFPSVCRIIFLFICLLSFVLASSTYEKNTHAHVRSIRINEHKHHISTTYSHHFLCFSHCECL